MPSRWDYQLVNGLILDEIFNPRCKCVLSDRQASSDFIIFLQIGSILAHTLSSGTR